jgi:Plant transposon protein
MLGKGCTWDLLYELSGVSAEVHRKWTLVFLAKFSTELYPIYVHGPRNNEELNKITSLYAACGFPGCVGSTDCVHIRRESCPSQWASAFRNGKHNYASIAYEMTVDHSKRFQATTIGHYGTTSDKTIVKFDGYVSKVRFDQLFTEAKFKVQISERKWIVEKGVYLLVDGGYHKWRIMICPLKHTVEEDKARWSEFAESIRKDVECSFSILKKRFQLLKNAINWHRKSDIDNAVFSCVILHNMLHEFDGYDKRWEAEIENTHFDKEEGEHLNRIRRRVVRAIENVDDYSHVGYLEHNINNIGFASRLDNDVAIEISTEHEILRNKLIKHLDMQYLNGKLRWLKI